MHMQNLHVHGTTSQVIMFSEFQFQVFIPNQGFYGFEERRSHCSKWFSRNEYFTTSKTVAARLVLFTIPFLIYD